MATFSQRYGYSPLKETFQREQLSEGLRTKLWNVLKICLWDRYKDQYAHHDETSKKIEALVQRLWFHFFNRDLDRFSGFINAYSEIKAYFFSCEWNKAYDFIEEISNDKSKLLSDEARGWINRALEEHNAAYRFVGEDIAEITDKNEIVAIEEGLAHPEMPVREHLASALRMLSDREASDFRNSIKESISAVEAACRLVTGKEKATLADALRLIHNLHPAMAAAFAKLYGYTSDQNGIRHSLIDEPVVTYADAKFMLVACAAFASYLKVSCNSKQP